MGVGDTTTHALAERHGIVGGNAVGNDHELLAAKTIGEVGHSCRGHDVENNALEHLVSCCMTETVVIRLEMIDIDQQQCQWPARGDSMFDGAVTVRFQRVAIESACKRIAAGARKQIFISLAIGQRIEYVPNPRDVRATPDWSFELDQIDTGENRVQRDGCHFGNPAANENLTAGAREHVKASEKCNLVESKYHDAGKCQPWEYPVAKPAARPLVEKDHDDAVEEQDCGSPDHQR